MTELKNPRGRILSGMRATGRLHLGHYHGILKNWVKLQNEFDCYFMMADIHTLTTHYEEPRVIKESLWDMVINCLAVGVDPDKAHIFIQSHVPEHAELHLLLSMITPLSWLERVPTYKDQQENLKERDLATYGFLGYPLLQSADILLYKPAFVPVGEDQVAHVEVTREIARRFNHLYGQEENAEEKYAASLAKLDKKTANQYQALVKAYQEHGEEDALVHVVALLDTHTPKLGMCERERLINHLTGKGLTILPEPIASLTTVSKLTGLDGRKMSKSYNNTINLRENPGVIAQKIRTMPTDPARVRRSDPGEPEKCPVWGIHKVYVDEATQQWVQTGCRSAGIGCLECKQPLIDAIQKEQAIFAERAEEYIAKPDKVRDIVANGCEAARRVARVTLSEVKRAMGLINE